MEPIKFDTSKTRKLIELVKQHELLYNTQRPEYRELALKAGAWDYIGRQLNMPGQVCKTLWAKLRNAFTNAMTRRRKNKKRNKKITPWHFEQEMSFLTPFVEWKGYSTDNCTDTTAANNFDEENFIKQSSDDEFNELDTTCVGQYPNDFDNNFYMNHSSNKHKNKIYKRNNNSNDKSVYLKSPIDETDLFFLSMSQTVKTLPKLEQARIKMNLHKMIFDAQEKYFQNNETDDDNDDVDEIIIKSETD